MRRGAMVRLSPTKTTFPQWLGTNNGDNFPLNNQTSAYTWKHPPAHLLNRYGKPSPQLPLCSRLRPTRGPGLEMSDVRCTTLEFALFSHKGRRWMNLQPPFLLPSEALRQHG